LLPLFIPSSVKSATANKQTVVFTRGAFPTNYRKPDKGYIA
jgi:hypothetical protein